jgi:hypothetical protein
MLTRYRTRLGTIPTKGSQRVLHDNPLHPCHDTPSARLFAVDVFCGCNFTNSYISTLRLSSFYTTLCAQTKHILHMRVTSTTVTCGQMRALMPSANFGIMSASSSAFGLKSSGKSWTLSATQRYCDFLETFLSGILEDLHVAVRQRSWFQHDRAPGHYGEDIRQRMNATYTER